MILTTGGSASWLIITKSRPSSCARFNAASVDIIPSCSSKPLIEITHRTDSTCIFFCVHSAGGRERNVGNIQGTSSRKYSKGSQVARTCILRAFGLQMPWRLSLVTFVLFCFVFVFMLSSKAAALRSIVLRYAGAPIARRVSFFFPFCLFGDVAFSEYFLDHCRFLFLWRVSRTFFPSAWCFSTL